MKKFTITRTTQTTYTMVVIEEDLPGKDLEQWIFEQQDDKWKTFDANATAEYNDDAVSDVNAPNLFMVHNPDGERRNWLEIIEEDV